MAMTLTGIEAAITSGEINYNSLINKDIIRNGVMGVAA
jgi:hypothetical protein